MDRREFLRNGARTLIVAGLGIMSGVLVYRKYTTESTCEDNMCKDCSSLKSCKLPEGVNYKNKVSR
ncbi:hypothetical protein [Labilibaculum sp.]|uniref:hypothetical protein n=1 Tax=Labilibaculum sp. TaxID=2060723 RepID=UPI00356A970B